MGKKPETDQHATPLARAQQRFRKLAGGLETSATFAKDLLALQNLRVRIDAYKQQEVNG